MKEALTVLICFSLLLQYSFLSLFSVPSLPSPRKQGPKGGPNGTYPDGWACAVAPEWLYRVTGASWALAWCDPVPSRPDQKWQETKQTSPSCDSTWDPVLGSSRMEVPDPCSNNLDGVSSEGSVPLFWQLYVQCVKYLAQCLLCRNNSINGCYLCSFSIFTDISSRSETVVSSGY